MFDRRARILLTGVATALVVAAPAQTNSACPGASTDPQTLGARKAAQVAACLVNVERAKRGLPALRVNYRLARTARSYAYTMVHRRFFDHVSPSGTTPLARIKATGYLRHARGWSVGENLAWGTGELATPESIVHSWMMSPGHRANILRRGFREFGMGVQIGAPVDLYDDEVGGTYATSFGSRG